MPIKFLLFLLPFVAFSQFKLTGVVKDSLSSIEFVNVVLKTEGKADIKGTITDKSGFFELYVSEGKYELSISFLGYKKWTKKSTIINNLKLFWRCF